MRLRKNIGIEYGIIIPLTLVSTLIRYSMWSKLELKGEFPMESIGYTFLFLTATWEFFRGMNKYLDRHIPFNERFLLRLNIQLVLGVIYMLIVNRLIFLIAGKYLEGSISVMFSMSTYATFIILSFLINSIFVGKHFFDEWKTSLLKAERLEREKTQVQFDNLKNQLNPHFLFNSLSSLHSLIFDSPGLASEYVNNLSKVYPYVLQHENQSLVALREELDFIHHFIFLLETRFQSGIKIQIEIPSGILDLEIVPVTLQILLENCIKHNAIDPENPLIIKIFADQAYLTVSNSVHPKTQITTSNERGLAQLSRLYCFLTEKQVRIETAVKSFSVSVPLIHRY